MAYRHSLKEIPLDVPSQICITATTRSLQVDGILYFPGHRPDARQLRLQQLHHGGDPVGTNLAAQVIGKLELDKTFEERDIINAQVVQAIDEAALNWDVKVLRYESKT